MAYEQAAGPSRRFVMVPEIGHVIGSRATARIATSALPGAPVLPECPQRRGVARRLLGALTGHSRTRA